MRAHRIAAGLAAASLALALAGCAPTGITNPVATPVVVSVEDLQGAVIEVAINNRVVFNPGETDVTTFTVEIADRSIAEFVEGWNDVDAVTNPGLEPLKVGETDVTLTGPDGDSDFVLRVLPMPAGANLGGVGR